MYYWTSSSLCCMNFSTTSAIRFIFIFLCITGIVLCPSPKMEPSGDLFRVIQTAHYHQGNSAVFGSASVGRQCVANSIVSLVKAKISDISAWTSEDMDDILHQGDSLYLSINPSRDLLEIEDIPSAVLICGQQWNIDKVNEHHSLINVAAIQSCLQEAFRSTGGAIVMLGDHSGASAVSLLKTSTSSFIFDPHSRSREAGMPTAEGTAVVVKLSLERDIVNYIYSVAQSIKAEQMSVWMINISAAHTLSCPQCSRSFRRPHNLKQHLTSCGRQQVDKTFQCEHCGRNMDNEYNLRSHMNRCKRKAVPNVKTWKCDNCSKICDNEFNLQEHIRKCAKKKKTVQNEYVCQHCSRVMCNQFNLKVHETKCEQKRESSVPNQSDLDQRQSAVLTSPVASRTRKRNVSLLNEESNHSNQPAKNNKLTCQTSAAAQHETASPMSSVERKQRQRSNPHSVAKERQQDSERKRLKRSNVTFAAAERTMNRQRIHTLRSASSTQAVTDSKEQGQHQTVDKQQNQRYAPDNIEHLREQFLTQHCVQQQSNDTSFRQAEKVKDRDRKRQKRKDTEFQKNERELAKQRMENYRAQSHAAENERKRRREWMHKRRSDPEYALEEFARRTLNKSGQSLAESIQVFVDLTREGPIYVCTSCHQTMFHDDVDDITSLRPGSHKEMLQRCCTQYLSVSNTEWICHTCKAAIYRGLYPKMSVANKVGFPTRPPELVLHPLEETLISPLLPFMTIRSLPIGGLIAEGQKMIVGNVVHVPNDIASTVKVLPRQLDDMGTLPVKLKRRKIYKTSVFQENIRPAKVLAALQYLKKHSQMYSRIMTDDSWEQSLSASESENRFFLEGHNAPIEAADERETQQSESLETFEEVPSSELTHGNLDTLLDEAVPVQVYQEADDGATMMEQRNLTEDTHRITVLAPGEGQIPVFRDPQAEYKCFPTIFCGEERPSQEERQCPVSLGLLFKAELRHVDTRVCLNIPNIFWKAKHLQIKQVLGRVNLALRRLVGPKYNKITAGDLLDPDKCDSIRRLNEGYRIFRSIRNSPPYFEHKKKELNAMIRQLGYPVLFFSLSSADTHWPDLIRCLGRLVDHVEYSIEHIEQDMTFAKKCQLVASHPAACSRFFHHRVDKFMKLLVTGQHSPFGIVTDFFHRVEYQKRGSPHVHGFLWIEGAPDVRTASEAEICAYVDSCISCSSDVPESEKPYLKLQQHSHNRTCRRMQKDKATCRFGAPWPPMSKTMILDPLDSETRCDIDSLKKQYNEIMKCLKSLPIDVQTFDEWLDHINLGKDKYILVVRSSIERRKLFLKRQPTETRVNAYMKNLLGAWRANHDIQFVLNCFQCVSYICDYMTKSQKGVSDTMHIANDEAEKGNMDLKNSVRHIGGKFINAAESPVQQCCADILQLPVTNSTRKKEYINTNPPETRVGLAKPMKTLEQMKPDAKDVTMMSNIDKYAIRPKAIESWCLADYVAKTDITYIKEKAGTEDDECEIPDPEQLETHEEELKYEEGSGFPFTLRSGHILRLRGKNKVLRYRRYILKTDPENYYREKLLLYTSWRKESQLKENCETYQESFMKHKTVILANMEKYEPVSTELDAAYEEFYEKQQAIGDNIERACAEDTDDPVALDDLPIFEPDPNSPLFRVDIGPDLGIAATQNDQDAVERVPMELSDTEYFSLLKKLNTKQQEFHMHVIQQAISTSHQSLCVLHGGAGTGKSTVIRALSEGLQRILRNQAGQDFAGQHIMLMAPTGKAAYNIHGQTIHRAFFIPASQRLDYRALKWDALNTIRSNFRSVQWIVIDEFSMVGKRMLRFIHLRLQEICGNKQPFGGMNIILVGDLHQLQPVKDGWIFDNMSGDYGALAPNLFKDYFEVFELDEIMRQKEDRAFAECLNRLRKAKHTRQDMLLLKSRTISADEACHMTDIPHFFTTNINKDTYNQTIMEQTSGRLQEITAIDVAPLDIPKREQQKALAAAKIKPVSGAGNLPYVLMVKEGVRYDVTANIAPNDGIVNGSECTVRHIDDVVADNLPKCIWVEFTDTQTGSELRKKVGSSYKQYTQRGWTPIQPINRTFVASKNNYAMTRKQFPLQMSSGRTIHKAQSATHEKIVVDMSGSDRAPRTFWEHIHYVAFSRCTNLQGLHIVDINEPQIRASPKVLHYLETEKTEMKLCYSPLYSMEGFKVAFNNVGSILRKWTALENNINILSADVVILAETWLSSNHSGETCLLPGFQQLRMDSTHRVGHRGMLMYIRQTLKVAATIFHQSEYMEMIHCQLQYRNQQVNVVSIYKPPTTSYAHFILELSECLSNFNMAEPLMLVGDFNIDICGNEQHRFLEYLQGHYNLVQYMSGPSTWDGTLIDLLFSNVSNVVSYSLVNTWSKHNIVFGVMP